MLASAQEYRTKRRTFFTFAFGAYSTVEVLGDTEAYICIAKRGAGTTEFEEEFFQFPQQLDTMLSYIEEHVLDHDLWYSAQLFSRKRRKKEYALLCPTAWSDLDACPPSKLLVKPSITVESSPGRFQALWRFDEPQAPFDAEQISKRIAYYHSEDGADRSGWDLTQILRIPFTHNFKYGGTFNEAPIVGITEATGAEYQPSAFDVYPKLAVEEYTDIPIPKDVPKASDVLLKYRHDLHPLAFILYSKEPESDWSGAMWSLINLLFESDLAHEEVYAVCLEAACNKYERDHRTNKHALLWKEVCRAYAANQHQEIANAPSTAVLSEIDILSKAERDALVERLNKEPTFVETYIEWAKSLGDAAQQYHQAGAFVALASVLSGSVRLPTSFGTVIPNLWFMILADTTLTRKTTSMDIAMDLIAEVNDQAVVATDGSIEGLMSSLALRPGTPSVFLRDEFSGLLESMTKKDYMSGMAELLTKLYDGKYQKRVLRKEVIEVKEPVLILFTGGIKNRIYELLTFDQVTSGFLPRFIFITAEADITKIKPVGPPTITSTSKRSELIFRLKDLYDHYNRIDTNNGVITKHTFKAELTPDAWARYNLIETQLLQFSLNSQHQTLLMPTFDRMSKSGLKAAVLIAASRQRANPVVVTEDDLIHAFSYVEKWLHYSIEVIQNIGKSTYEKTLDRIYEAVRREPGIMRGTIMKLMSLSSRQADDMLSTLEQRGMIRSVKSGKSIRLEPFSG